MRFGGYVTTVINGNAAWWRCRLQVSWQLMEPCVYSRPGAAGGHSSIDLKAGSARASHAQADLQGPGGSAQVPKQGCWCPVFDFLRVALAGSTS